METGLIVKGRTQIDNSQIEQLFDDSIIYYEWNFIEGYFFLPEQPELYDELEIMVKNVLSADINYHVEGIF